MNPAQKNTRHPEEALLAQIADMYYNRDRKLTEIAQAFSFSTAKVSRLLHAAREAGIVEIRVKRIFDRITGLEQALKKQFGLSDAVVAGTYPDMSYEEKLDAVTSFAADYVSAHLMGKMVLGLSNGESVNRVVSKIKPTHVCDLDIVQLMGSGGGEHFSIESRDLVTRIAEIFPGGRTFFVNAPLYIESKHLRDEFLREETVARTFQLMQTCDMLLTGIGAFGTGENDTPAIIREYLTTEHISEMDQKGSIGCICAQFYDKTGRTIPCRWNSNCISMPLTEVKKNPMTVAVCCGEKKAEPVRGALNGGYVNVLVTDAQVASHILQG